jgi:hypothetical protein
MTEIVTNFQKRRAHSLAAGLISRLCEYASDFPTGTAFQLIETVKELAKEIQTVAGSSNDQEIIELSCYAVQQLGSYLTFFDNAHTEQTPSGLAFLIEHLVKCVKPGAEVLLWPQSGYNYSLRRILPQLKHLVENILPQEANDRIFSKFNAEVFVISFPRIERNNTLTHVVFGHEVGHIIADEFLEYELTTSDYQASLGKLMQQITAAFPQQNAIPNLHELTQYTNLVLLVRKRALQELLSDMTQWLFFGPSALFASFGILFSSSLDAPPSDPSFYPPSRQRLRLLYDLFVRSNVKAELDKVLTSTNLSSTKAQYDLFIGSISEIVSSDSDQQFLRTDPILKIAYDWIEATLPSAQKWTEARLTNYIFDQGTIAHISGLIERLDLSIPPNECGVYPNENCATWQLAFLSGWLYKLQGVRVTGDKTTQFTEKEASNIDALVLRAIENIFLSNRYAKFVQEQT